MAEVWEKHGGWVEAVERQGWGSVGHAWTECLRHALGAAPLPLGCRGGGHLTYWKCTAIFFLFL